MTGNNRKIGWYHITGLTKAENQADVYYGTILTFGTRLEEYTLQNLIMSKLCILNGWRPVCYSHVLSQHRPLTFPSNCFCTDAVTAQPVRFDSKKLLRWETVLEVWQSFSIPPHVEGISSNSKLQLKHTWTYNAVACIPYQKPVTENQQWTHTVMLRHWKLRFIVHFHSSAVYSKLLRWLCSGIQNGLANGSTTKGI